MGSERTSLFVLYLTGLCLLTAFTCVLCQNYITPSEVDLCSKRPGVEPNGEDLTPGGSLVAYVNWTIENPAAVKHCYMRFSTCHNCRLRVKAAEYFNYPSCGDSRARHASWCVPGCTYVRLYDRFYIDQTSVSYTSSSSIDFSGFDFHTESSILYMIVCSNKSSVSSVQFRLNISAEEKTEVFKSDLQNLHQSESFHSPFFPQGYSLNSEEYTYIFQAASRDYFITINFDDWQLSQYSSIQFDSANIKGKIMGTSKRPWIISDSHRLMMTFRTGGIEIPGSDKASKGFRATYTFHYKNQDFLPFVHTDCGQGIHDFYQESGVITFNPTGNGMDYYDCIWIIKKPPSFQSVMVQVINYTSQDTTYRVNRPSKLEIRHGATSLGSLQDLAYPSSRPNIYFHDHTSEQGFYVRVRGHYYGEKDFVMSYTAFNIDRCRGLFKCQNRRCISRDLLCNRIDNCGDRSDEDYDNCGTVVPPTGTRSSTSVLSVSIIIPMVISIFLIVVICLLFLFIRRCRRLSMEARRAQSQHQNVSTISGSSGSNGRHLRRHRRHDDHNGERGGTPYDPPPSYADVLNNTPIGYLNLGFADACYSVNGPVEPPSYEEAISSPSGNNATFNFQGRAPHEDSSDSSSPLSGGHSQANLSTSYSSDDTHLSTNQHHRCRAASLSSSDSSTDCVCIPSGESEERQRNVSRDRSSSQVIRDENHPTQTALTANSLHGIAKPEGTSMELPHCSSVDIAGHTKNLSKTSNKSTNTMQGENESPAVIRMPPGSIEMLSSPDPESGERRIAPAAGSTSRVEQSPVILAPTLLSLSSSLSCDDGGEVSSLSAAANGTRSSLQQCDLPGSEVQLCHGPNAVLEEGASSLEVAALENQCSSQRGRQNRPSPTKNIPAHIRRAKGSSLMRNISRSMNDISRHTEPGHTDRWPGGGEPGFGLPSRQFSQSVQNIAEIQPPLRRVQRADSGDGLVIMDTGPQHHQSQPLLSAPVQPRHLNTRKTPRQRGNDSHHRDIYRQSLLEDQHCKAGDRNESRARPPLGAERSLDRPTVHSDQTRGPGRPQSHHHAAEDNGRHDRPRTDRQEAQRHSEAPSYRQLRSHSQPRDGQLGLGPGEGRGRLRPDRPSPDHRGQTQTAPSRPSYSPAHRASADSDAHHRPQSGVVEERRGNGRPPGNNARHTSQGQHCRPYSHSLDRQGACPGHGRDPTRNALSLDRSGQHIPPEHQRPHHPLTVRGQSRARLPSTSSDRPPLLPKPVGASPGSLNQDRNHHKSNSGLTSERDVNHMPYPKSDRPPPYRPPPPSAHALGTHRRSADVHMAPSPADKPRLSCRPPGSHNPESDRHPEQSRQWSQPSGENINRDTGPDSQARHTAMVVHQRPSRPPKPARTSYPPSNASPGPLSETNRLSYLADNTSTAMSAAHVNDDKSSSSPLDFFSSIMDSPKSFTGALDSVHSSSASPIATAASTNTTTANATASNSLQDNSDQKLPPVHGTTGSAEYTSHQSQPLDQMTKEDSDQILNENNEAALNTTGGPSGAVSSTPGQTLQDSHGAGAGSHPVLYLQLANGDGEGEFEENDIYV